MRNIRTATIVAIITFALLLLLDKVIFLAHLETGVSVVDSSTYIAQQLKLASEAASKLTLYNTASNQPEVEVSNQEELSTTNHIAEKHQGNSPISVVRPIKVNPTVTVSSPAQTVEDIDDAAYFAAASKGEGDSLTPTVPETPKKEPAPAKAKPASIERKSGITADVYGGVVCNSSVAARYKEKPVDKGDGLKWCTSVRDQFHVIIGKSWGGLGGDRRKQWDANNCNELLTVGELQPCSKRWGWESFSDWQKDQHIIVSGHSTVDCRLNLKASALCRYDNSTMDFSKQHVNNEHGRGFTKGFLTTYGTLHPGPLSTVNIDVVGKDHKRNVPAEGLKCDVYEDRPVFVLSNDDIYNIGHYFNDVATIWNMLVMWGVNGKDAVLLNFDGLRTSGPAGGFHRLMNKRDPDDHGPYVQYYASWFGELKKAKDYGTAKVCFKSLYFMPAPGMPWFWNDWGRVSDCTLVASSPLYQSFNRFLINKWQLAYGKLPDPDSGDTVHVVIEVRAINPAKGNVHNTARHISNLPELVAALKSIKNVRLTTQDFAKIPFPEQVALSHSAGVFISMHGAGTTHIFHSAIGKPNCCALIELQPDHSIGFQTAWGYANLARMIGMHYWRAEADDGATKPKGTRVNVGKLKQVVEDAVAAVRSNPTCLHDVRES